MIKDTPKGLPDSALDFEREPTEAEKEMVDTQDVVKYMERTYPEMTGEFLKIQSEQYELFCRKQYDYGPQNIAVGTILKTPEDIKLSLLGLWFRMNDKIERMKTLLLRNGVNSVEGEPVTDSFSDVSNYGVMAQVVARGKWAKIGVIGQGYVGSAIKVGFKPYYEVSTYDKFDISKSTHGNLNDVVNNSEVIFVCVPTPMSPDGTCHTGIVEEVVKEIAESAHDKQIVVIKSTVPPGTTDRLHRKYRNISVIFNPEFLTEANFIEDFKNQNRIILGGTRNGTNIVRQLYSRVFPHATIVKTGAKHAEMVKYFTNCFLATKVSFANEMKYICDSIDLDYDKVVEYATYDERLGKSHWAVPGPDGDLGFGGHCLPKDLSAIINQFETLGLLEAVEQVNDQVREDRDWEQMKGRAVIDG